MKLYASTYQSSINQDKYGEKDWPADKGQLPPLHQVNTHDD